ncbi:NAD(P)/FAD-dependent oxidoreductase [Halomonas sp. GFAJ-1]|uniref:NAD(P)/FAD-dependent oxidoreductase n=1 Tax=Halomonas sp. GFAJ-1 TaxID=1118153 RepID=UPI00023A5952|nr:FAD-dependent oxidoreductase [Halomonas sp. GFAJ-1]AVI62542.1 amino acid oxidase [Halomonas sp. GFAJ-1]EHK62348.1 glycine/D-amino acid oxidase [Halomonas sp. GFAJ-1]
MDLKSGYPFWAVKNGLLTAFPQLIRDHECEVVIIGGGITGALIANELSRHGHHVVVVERREVGWGSSAASTALLQYEIDTHMVDLAEQYGEANAVMAYQACADAILTLEGLAAELGNVAFERHHSLYYASNEEDVAALKAELALRQQHGFDVTWLERHEVLSTYGFEAPGAILSELAASIDPYRMAYQLFEKVVAQGGEVYDRTQVERIEPSAQGVEIILTNGVSLRCQQVVIAAGYESQNWLPESVAANRSSYAFVTDPLPYEALGILRHTLVWESARPYLYMRSTQDGRLLVGGDDDEEDIPERRDARVIEKAQGLAAKIETLWPALDINPTFCWAGTFAETSDGLPYFGPHASLGPRVHFALAYGGNGITYSVVGAKLLRALIEGNDHPLAELYSFQRLKRQQ